jgi:hypothetical protein
MGFVESVGAVDEQRVKDALRVMSYSAGAKRRDSFQSFEDAIGYGLCRGCWVASKRLRCDFLELLGWAWLDTMSNPRVCVRSWERAGVSGLVNHFRWACLAGWRRAKGKRPDMALSIREVPSGLYIEGSGWV